MVARQMFYITCDHEACLEESVRYNDPQQALSEAVKDEWLIDNGCHYCPDHICFCEICNDVVIPWTDGNNVCDNCLLKKGDSPQGQSIPTTLRKPNTRREVSNRG